MANNWVEHSCIVHAFFIVCCSLFGEGGGGMNYDLIGDNQ